MLNWRIIQSIAHTTWPVTYGQLLSSEQLKYMLDAIYNEASITNQMENMKHEFIIMLHSENPFGFASIEQHFQNTNQLMLHKLYLLPEFQGKGYGKAFINHINKIGLDTGHDGLCLKVFHKNVKGIAFYKSIGFSIYAQERTDIGNGYEIFDYVMV